MPIRVESTERPCATILEDRGIPVGRAEGTQLRTLGAALAHTFKTDAHFQQGYAQAGGRFGTSSLPVTMTCIAFDVDAPKHQATPEWRDQVSGVIETTVLAAHPDAFVYQTRNGFRLVWSIDPVAIASKADAAAWRRRYLTIVAYFDRRFGLKADRSCGDFARLFRLPKVTRPPATEPEIFPSVLDDCCFATNIGRLSVTPTDDDTEAARKLAPRLFGESVPRPTSGTSAAPQAAAVPARPMGGAGASQGLLHTLLSARGHVLGPLAVGEVAAFRVRCPRSRLHSTGDAEAALYPPRGGGPGAIHCFHDSCSDLEADDWLREFSEPERAAAGIRQGEIKSVWIDAHAARAVRLCLQLENASGTPMPYLRVAAGTAAYGVLWKVTGVEPPCDTDAAGDLGGAVRELKGRSVAALFSGTLALRIMSAVERRAVAA